MKIGIRFHDNDFYFTVTSFLELFIDSKLVKKPENITKARIVELWEMLVPGLYWLRQNGFQYRTDEKEHMSKYLRIEARHVFLDAECDIFINQHPNDNGEFHWVDLDLKIVQTV